MDIQGDVHDDLFPGADANFPEESGAVKKFLEQHKEDIKGGRFQSNEWYRPRENLCKGRLLPLAHW